MEIKNKIKNKRGQVGIIFTVGTLIVIGVIILLLIIAGGLLINTIIKNIFYILGALVFIFGIIFGVAKAEKKNILRNFLIISGISIGIVLLQFTGLTSQTEFSSGTYIQAPTFYYYECNAASQPIESSPTILTSGSSNGWITCPDNTDSCDLLISQTESTAWYSLNRRIVYQICHLDGQYCDNQVFTTSNYFSLDNANIPSIRINGLLTTDRVWVDYQYQNLLFQWILKPNGVVIFTAAGMFTAKVIMSMPYLYKYSLVWEKTTKTNFLNTKRQFLRSHEDIVIFYDKQPTFNPIITTGHKRKVSTADHKRNSKMTTNYGAADKVSYDSTDRYSGSVLKFANDKQKNSINPTQKPVALLETLFKTFTNEGDTVLDCYAGSGTAGEVAVKLNRHFVGCELTEEYFEIASKRINEANMQLHLGIA